MAPVSWKGSYYLMTLGTPGPQNIRKVGTRGPYFGVSPFSHDTGSICYCVHSPVNQSKPVAKWEVAETCDGSSFPDFKQGISKSIITNKNFTLVFAPIPSISTGPTFCPWECRHCFPKRWNWQICTPTGHLDFHFAPFVVSYELFLRWNQKQLDFSSIERKVHSSSYLKNSAWVTSGKRAAKQSLFKSSWHVLPSMVHVLLRL